MTGTHCVGGWVGPRAGVDGCGKSRSRRDSIRCADRPARCQSLYWLRHPDPPFLVCEVCFVTSILHLSTLLIDTFKALQLLTRTHFSFFSSELVSFVKFIFHCPPSMTSWSFLFLLVSVTSVYVPVHAQGYFWSHTTYVLSRVQKFTAWHTLDAPNGNCCEEYVVLFEGHRVASSQMRKVCWNKWKVLKYTKVVSP
jgi:hypothetical protein